MAARVPTGGRPIKGLAAPGSKPAGRSEKLKLTADVKQLVDGPNMLRQTQGTAGGGGVTINSQPVN